MANMSKSESNKMAIASISVEGRSHAWTNSYKQKRKLSKRASEENKLRETSYTLSQYRSRRIISNPLPYPRFVTKGGQ